MAAGAPTQTGTSNGRKPSTIDTLLTNIARVAEPGQRTTSEDRTDQILGTVGFHAVTNPQNIVAYLKSELGLSDEVAEEVQQQVELYEATRPRLIPIANGGGYDPTRTEIEMYYDNPRGFDPGENNT